MLLLVVLKMGLRVYMGNSVTIGVCTVCKPIVSGPFAGVRHRSRRQSCCFPVSTLRRSRVDGMRACGLRFVTCVWALLQEERFLLRHEWYQRDSSVVRWRLLPLVW